MGLSASAMDRRAGNKANGKHDARTRKPLTLIRHAELQAGTAARWIRDYTAEQVAIRHSQRSASPVR